MFLIRLCAVVLFSLLPIIVWAQKQLKITDELSGNTIESVALQFYLDSSLYIADENGIILIDSEKEGWALLTHVAYQAKKIYLHKTYETQQVFLHPNNTVLKNTEIVAFGNELKLTQVAGSYGKIDESVLSSYKSESLLKALNTISGVRMEERATNSYRIGIRGSLIRSPFGVRNIKTYWNGIPLTDPRGNTFINLLDNSQITALEVMKGPSASIYGASIGGVLLLKSKKHKPEGTHYTIGSTVGSFGFKKIHATLDHVEKKSAFTLNIAHQEVGGYRDHSSMDRNVIQLTGEITPDDKRTWSYNIAYTDLFYQLPGGLTAEQFAEDPTQARFISVTQNASIDQNNLFAGISHNYQMTNWGNNTAIYFSNGNKTNPFITNYENEAMNGAGFRTAFYKNIKTARSRFRLMIGGEYQYGQFEAQNYGNVAGYVDTLRFDDETFFKTGFVFGQVNALFGDSWSVTGGISVNGQNYKFNRVKDVALNTSYLLKRQIKPVVSPRVGIVKKMNSYVSAHSSISYGFSVPTQDELRTSDGAINLSLAAEKGVNYELGVRGNIFQDKLSFDVVVFLMHQKKTIVSQMNEVGVSSFFNAGSTKQKGIETSMKYVFLNNPKRYISNLSLNQSLTVNGFSFDNYVKQVGGENVDYSGNKLTGTPSSVVVTVLNIKSSDDLSLNVTHNFTSAIPLNDANTVYSNQYNLINIQIDYVMQWKKGLMVKLLGGVDNVLNETYSLGNDLNAFGNRYFNPAATTNYYLGFKFEF